MLGFVLLDDAALTIAARPCSLFPASLYLVVGALHTACVRAP